MTENTLPSRESVAWAERLTSLYLALKPYRKARSVISIRNDSSSNIDLTAAFVSNGAFATDPGIGNPLKPGDVRLISVKAHVGAPGYDFYAVLQVASPTKGDSFATLVACRWTQPKSFTALAPPDVRVGLTSLHEFKGFSKKTAYKKLQHKDIEFGPTETSYGQICHIVKETEYTTKARPGVAVTGISAINSEFVVADLGRATVKPRKKPKKVQPNAKSWV